MKSAGYDDPADFANFDAHELLKMEKALDEVTPKIPPAKVGKIMRFVKKRKLDDLKMISLQHQACRSLQLEPRLRW